MSQTPDLTYEAILKLDLEEIEARYPNGLRAIPLPHEKATGKWRPARDDEKPHKTLPQLRADKKQHKRMQDEEYMHRRSQMGYTEDPHMALEKAATPPRDVVDDFTVKAQDRHRLLHAEEQARAEVRSLMASLRQVAKEAVKAGMDPVEAVAIAAGQRARERRKAA